MSAESRRGPSDDYTPVPTALEVSAPTTLEDPLLPGEGEDACPPPAVDPRINWVHFFLGCAVLLPWNVMVTAVPFFLSRLEGSSVKDLFSSYLSVSFTLSNFLFLAHATASTKSSSPARAIKTATLQIAFLNFCLALSTFVRASSGLFAFFVILAGVAMAASGSYLQTSVVAVASLFGPSTMQSVMSGQAAVAIVLSAIQLLSATASVHISSPNVTSDSHADDAAEKSSRTFFTLSTLFLLATAVANTWMTRLPSYKAVVGTSPHKRTWSRRLSQDVGEERAFLAESQVEEIPQDSTRGRIMDVARKNMAYEIAAAYVFAVSLSVYPPITLAIQPVDPGTNLLIFSSVHFLVFNVGDFLGRYLCSYPRLLVWSAKRLLTLSLGRTLFIPLFLMCNISPVSGKAPPVINSDVLFFLILLAFGLSNGYVSSMCMMSAPSLEHNPYLKGNKEDVDIAATVASFCLVGGLVIGSFASFGVRATMCRCNPFIG